MNERTVALIALAVLAALALAGMSAVWGGWFLAIGILYLVPVALIVGVIGAWLALNRNQIASMTGYAAISFAVAIILFPLVAMPVYAAFYGYVPSDRDPSDSAVALKIGFWSAVAAHLLVTTGATIAVARRLRWPLLSAALGGIAAPMGLAYPMVAYLSWLNNCYGLEYPMGRIACG